MGAINLIDLPCRIRWSKNGIDRKQKRAKQKRLVNAVEMNSLDWIGLVGAQFFFCSFFLIFWFILWNDLFDFDLDLICSFGNIGNWNTRNTRREFQAKNTLSRNQITQRNKKATNQEMENRRNSFQPFLVHSI